MSDEDIDLRPYKDKRVKFVLINGDGTKTEIEGMVDLVNWPAMLIKPKGSTMLKMISIGSIYPGSLEVIEDKPREIKPRRVELGSMTNSRHHLLDRHSYELPVINEMTDEIAYAEHAKIDHRLLGHFHLPRGESQEDDE